MGCGGGFRFRGLPPNFCRYWGFQFTNCQTECLKRKANSVAEVVFVLFFLTLCGAVGRFLLSLSQMAFQSQPNDFSFGAENIFLSARRPDTLLAWVENVPENGVAMRFRGSFLLYLGRFIGLKRIGRLSCESCFMLTFPLLYLRMPCPFVVFCERQKSWTVDRLFILQLARIAYFLVLPV